MNISVTIEKLVLDGFDLTPTDRAVLTGAMREELGRLLATEGLGEGWPDGSVIGHIDAGQIEYGPGRSPTETGRQIAGAVYGGLRR